MQVENQIFLPYKTTLINNRRYLGNKYKLLPFIKDIVNNECENVKIIADIFSGTGAVASAFADKQLITNDILYFNYLCHIAWFSSDEYNKSKIITLITQYNAIKANQDNYVSQNFSDTFFSDADCKKIGLIRQDIEDNYVKNHISFREKAILITSLLYAMDKVANTCGHYDAYRKNGELYKRIELCVPLVNENNNLNNVCFNIDSNELVKNMNADLVYIDPPYNSRQYCDAYHLLENVARWEKPKVYGESRKMNRVSLKSDYCSSKATIAFENLIKNINSKYILLSYNNMAQKGNSRSNAKIADEDIVRILSKKGEVKIFTQNYKPFTTGKSDIKNNEERLFLCICNNDNNENDIKETIKSPLNYMGGKHKLLQQLLPLFPEDISNFIDLFCGGCSVGLNVKSNATIFNDKDSHLVYLYNAFKNLDKDETFRLIDETIEKYKLSRSDVYSYNYYNCNGADGLGSYNSKGFLELRNDFNTKMNKDYFYYVVLYVLIVFSFNNQIRFNKNGEFNLPVGKRDFNKNMREKLSRFIDILKENNFIFTQKDFRNIEVLKYDRKTFVYIDPPYLITNATYNEKDGWTETDEKSLLDYIDNIHNYGYRFALSNVLENKGKKNKILVEWLEQNKDMYTVHHLNNSYANANYQAKNRNELTDEVLVVNYSQEIK